MYSYTSQKNKYISHEVSLEDRNAEYKKCMRGRLPHVYVYKNGNKYTIVIDHDYHDLYYYGDSVTVSQFYTPILDSSYSAKLRNTWYDLYTYLNETLGIKKPDIILSPNCIWMDVHYVSDIEETVDFLYNF